MPLREYECPNCFTSTEILQGADEDHKPDCPKCGTSMEKQFSTFGVYVWQYGLDAFGTPQYADASRKRAGVPNG